MSIASIVAPSCALAALVFSRGAFAQVATPPRLLVHDDVPVPEGAPPAERVVVVFVTIEPDGAVGPAAIADGAGPPFDDAALEAVHRFQFAPATRGGAPIRARIRVPVRFVVPPAPAPAPTAAAPVAPATPTPAVPASPPAAATPPPASATSPSAPPAAAEPVEVSVVGAARPPNRGASDFNLRVGDLAAVPRKNAAELLKLAPGILLTNEGGEGHAEQVFLRGFDAREGQDIEFTVGGVPINESGNLHGNGYSDTHFILPELVTDLRVLEGPFDPRQGNYAVAGSADYELGLDDRGLIARATYGSWNTLRGLVLWGPPGQSNRTFGGAEIYSTDGFGQNRQAKRASAIGQYEGKMGQDGWFRVTAQAFADSYGSAGVIREDDYERGIVGFYGTMDTRQGGDDSRYSVAASLGGKAGGVTYTQQVFVIDRGMRLRENFTGFLLDVQTPLQEPHGQRGDLIDLDMTEMTLGARGSARIEGKLFGQKQELELGYYARGDHVDGTEYRIEAATGAPYHLDTDLESKLGDIAIYADAGLRPASWITLRGGLRADLLAFDVLDKCAVHSVAHPSPANPPGDASCLSQENMGAYREPVQRASTATTAVLPRGSLLLGPAEGFVFSGSLGRGVRSVDPSYVIQSIPTPFASVLAYDGGVAYGGGVHDTAIAIKSIFFQTKVDHDLIFSETAGSNVLAGPTTRTGWLVAARVTGRWFDASGNATFVKSTFDDTGLLVPYVPDVVTRFDGSVHGDLPWVPHPLGRAIRGSLSSGLTFIGDRPLPYGERSDPVFTLDGSGTLAWTHYEVSLVCTNIIGSKYKLGEYNYASDFHTEGAPTLVPSRLFSAGPPRAFFVTLGLHFGGES